MKVGDEVILLKDINGVDGFPEYHQLPKERKFPKGSKAEILEAYEKGGGIIKICDRRLLLFDFDNAITKEG